MIIYVSLIFLKHFKFDKFDEEIKLCAIYAFLKTTIDS